MNEDTINMTVQLDGETIANATIPGLRDGYESQHVMAVDRDASAKYTAIFDPNLLSQLLFCDTYVIEKMEIGDDGKLYLHARYAGASLSPLPHDRVLTWDMQQHEGKGGVVQFGMNHWSKEQ